MYDRNPSYTGQIGPDEAAEISARVRSDEAAEPFDYYGQSAYDAASYPDFSGAAVLAGARDAAREQDRQLALAAATGNAIITAASLA